MIGGSISHYRILDRLGRGGMGEVYVALDETLQRKVALKAIRRSLRLDAESRARFLREARILSHLDHPGICRIHDYVQGAEADFLVLELVEGRSLRTAIVEGLDAAARMRIAEQIAGVLVAAHTEGVVHRDLKPDNVMVTPAGDVKVLDFGLARASLPGEAAPGGTEPADSSLPPVPAHPEAAEGSLSPTRTSGDTGEQSLSPTRTSGAATDGSGPSGEPSFGSGETDLLTRRGSLMGTPVYMSPEQARGEPATTASDMYSFGLLLQNLCTGRRPYEAGLDTNALLERVREGRTLPISGVDGDLAALVNRLKALAPAARPTAVEAAARLQWIREKPRRRMRRAIAAAVVLALVLAAAKYTLDLQHERSLAVAAQQEAERRRGQAEDLIGFMLGDLHDKLNEVGRLEILDEAGNKALAYFESLPSEDLTGDELLRRSKALSQLADVRMAQGRHDEAMELFGQSFDLARRLAASDPANLKWQHGLAERHNAIGFLHWKRGNLDGALERFLAVMGINDGLVAADPANPEWRKQAAYAHNNVGFVHQARGDYAAALEQFIRTLEIKKSLAAENPDDLDLRLDVAHSLNSIASAHELSGNLEEAARFYRSDLEIKGSLVAADPQNTIWLKYVAISHSLLGGVQQDTGDLRQALEHFRKAVSTLRGLARTDPGNTDWQYNLAVNLRREGVVLLGVEGPRAAGAARARFEESLRIMSDLVSRDPSLGRWRRGLARTHCELGRAFEAAGRLDEALASTGRARALLDSMTGDGAGGSQDTLRALGSTLNLEGTVWMRKGRADRAHEAWRRSVEALRPAGADSTDKELLDPLVTALLHLGRIDEARPLARKLRDLKYRNPTFLALCEAKGV